MERLDEDQIATLRVWAEGLARDPREEVRAAARAISLLVEEVESLHVALWHARGLGVEPAEADPAPSPAPGRWSSVFRSGLQGARTALD